MARASVMVTEEEKEASRWIEKREMQGRRSTFARTEQSFRSLCELCHWTAIVVWSHPRQFKWLALRSLVVVGVSMLLFGNWASRLGNDS